MQRFARKITVEDILNRAEKVLSLDNLISSSKNTHDAIHFGDASILIEHGLVERRPNDTIPWKQ